MYNFYQSQEGILQILEVVKQYEKDGEVRFIEGIQRCGFNEHKVQRLIAIVRERLNITRREFFRLSEFAVSFNKLWATDDNNCFQNADKFFRKIRSTLKGTKIIFKKFTPIVRKKNPNMDYRPSELVNSTLAHAASGHDLYGMDTYPDSVTVLYSEMGAYFTNVVAVLVLCHQEITKEAMIRQDAELCLKLLNDQCKTIVTEMRDVLDLLSKEAVVKDELFKKSKSHKSLASFAQQGFHNYNITSIKRFAAAQAITNGAEFGLDDIESLYFVEDPEKGKKAKEIMPHFDDYVRKGSGTKMDALPIAECICWTGLGLQKGYEFFTKTYKGKYDLPKRNSIWARMNKLKQGNNNNDNVQDKSLINIEIERTLAQDFEKRIKNHGA